MNLKSYMVANITSTQMAIATVAIKNSPKSLFGVTHFAKVRKCNECILVVLV